MNRYFSITLLGENVVGAYWVLTNSLENIKKSNMQHKTTSTILYSNRGAHIACWSDIVILLLSTLKYFYWNPS